MTAPLRLGTRRSPLATAQASLVAAALTERTGREVELVPVTTLGDTSKAALTQIGGTGVFVSALREALLDARVDLAVHSLKDLPTADADGIRLAAVPVREDPRDALVARDGLTLGELPGRRPRRHRLAAPRRPAARARARPRGRRRPGQRRHPARPRRDRRARRGRARPGRAGPPRPARAVTEVIDPLQMLPAPGQGALAVECRTSEDATEPPPTCSPASTTPPRGSP